MHDTRSIQVVVYGDTDALHDYSGRTYRSLRKKGIASECTIPWQLDSPCSSTLQVLRNSRRSVWFIQAGAWLPSNDCEPEKPLHFPLPSARRLPVCALGCTLSSQDGGSSDNDAHLWQSLLQKTAGDIEAIDDFENRLPPIRSCFLQSELTHRLLSRIDQGSDLLQALKNLAVSDIVRTLSWQPIDIHFDAKLRVVQLITSLQRGGAERLAIDLHRHLQSRSYRSRLISLAAPFRQTFPTPLCTFDLSQLRIHRDDKLHRCIDEFHRFGADIVHAHLLRTDDLKTISSSGVPIIVTIHNMKPGWTDTMSQLKAEHVSLLVACSRAVERELTIAAIAVPTRTVWNGIAFTEIPARELLNEGQQLSAEPSIPPKVLRCEGDFIITAIANPRPQKRLERLPSIAAVLQRRLDSLGCNRRVRLLIAGEASQNNVQANESMNLMQHAIIDSGIAHQIDLLGPVSDIADLLSRTDVLVSTSAYEGLSLAHLEALANNVPVVSTDVGGTREIAHRCDGLKLVREDASADDFVDAMMESVRSPREQFQEAIARDFSSSTMVATYSRLYKRTIATQARKQGSGLLLVINNFSTGGAQSSAKRLLHKLKALGVPVRAAVLEELERFPTVGRRGLSKDRIEVTVLEPAGSIDPLAAIQPLLRSIDRDPPKSIVFWNAIAEYKLLIADSVWGIPVFDVSPGEMLYSSFERYWQRPRPGLAYLGPTDYGMRLKGVVVKYEAERSIASSYFNSIVHVVPNGVPIRQPVNLRQRKLQLQLGTVARISKQKKLEELIEAVRIVDPAMPAYRLQIVGGVERGSEEYAEHLHALSCGLPVDWIGEREDPSELLEAWDMFVLVSEPAGCPNAGLEAMSRGLPIIATDAGGASEQVIDDVNGRLVPRGDIPALAQAIMQIANDRSLRIRYGQSSHQRAKQRFSIDRMVADYRRILEV